MSDRRLKVFREAAKLLSFTKAAEALYMTQPTVTFHILQLEGQLDARLFERTNRRVSLTEAGRIAYEYSEHILEQYNKMENSIREIPRC